MSNQAKLRNGQKKKSKLLIKNKQILNYTKETSQHAYMDMLATLNESELC